MEWLFDGLGTELVSMIIGLFLGAGAGGIAAVSYTHQTLPTKTCSC